MKLCPKEAAPIRVLILVAVNMDNKSSRAIQNNGCAWSLPSIPWDLSITSFNKEHLLDS